MHHRLKYDSLFTVTDGNLWESCWSDIVGELYETKKYPWADPEQCYEPSPATSQMIEKTFCTRAIIVLTKNHAYQSQRTGSSESRNNRKRYKSQKCSYTYHSTQHVSEPYIGTKSDKENKAENHSL
jgi:hypothetical protein